MIREHYRLTWIKELEQIGAFIDIFNREYENSEFKMTNKSWEILEQIIDKCSEEIGDSILLYIKAILSDRKSWQTDSYQQESRNYFQIFWHVWIILVKTSLRI